MHETDWTRVEVDPRGIEVNLPIAGWLRLFREVGFEVQDHAEVQAPAGGEEARFLVERSWERRWPSERVWWLRKA